MIHTIKYYDAIPCENGGGEFEPTYYLRSYGKEEWYKVSKEDYNNCIDDGRKKIVPEPAIVIPKPLLSK